MVYDETELDALRAQRDTLVEALAGLYSLVKEGWLVRTTVNDAHFPSYLKESARLVATLKAVEAALASVKKEERRE